MGSLVRCCVETPVNENAFLAALERQLRLQGMTFDVGELVEYIEEVWLTAQKTPDDIDRWAAAFVATQQVEVMR